MKGKELFEAEPVANASGMFWVTGVQPWPANYFQPNTPIASNLNVNETQMCTPFLFLSPDTMILK